MSTPLPTRILSHAASLAEGSVLSAKELLHLGNRAAVDQALTRLARQGKLMRSGHGLYVHPVEGRFGTRPPAAEKVVREVAKVRGETVVPHGAAAANRLGLTTQVPMRMTYLTSGPTRQMRLGNQTIELRHAPSWQLANTSSTAGEVIRAMAWGGQERAMEMLGQLKPKLSAETRQELLASRAAVPQWVAEVISSELGLAA